MPSSNGVITISYIAKIKTYYTYKHPKNIYIINPSIIVLSNLFLRNVIGKELLLDIMLFFLCIQTQIGNTHMRYKFAAI